MINRQFENKKSTKILNKNLSSVIKIVLAFILSLRLSLLPHEVFKDRENYFFQISNSKDLFFGLFNSDTPIFLNEPLFKLSNYVLSFLFHPETTLSLYVFLNCFIVFLFVLFNRRSFSYTLIALIFLLLIPYSYGGMMGAIRQGLGFNFILISLMRGNSLTSKRMVFSFFIASLFHVVFFIFLFLVIVYKALRSNINSYKYILPVSFMIVLVIGFFWNLVTPYLISSQRYEDFEGKISGITFLAWLVIFILFYYNYLFLKKNRKNFNESIYLLSLLMFFCFIVFYWLAPGPYRILYSCSPLLICSLMSNFNRYSALCFLSIFIYSCVLFYIGAGAGTMNIEFTQFLSVFFTNKF